MTETYRQNTQPLNLGRESVADMEGHYQSTSERAIKFSGHGESAAMARTYRNISEPLKVSDHTVAYQDLYQQDVLHGTHA
ncbi:hypothetical protein [Kushneria phosphatilytica]|nr:hypothetical protein [Kushneria phosphatilytica]OHV08761.1 hypothetical protein BH688_12125 [Kushneria phosphatilytica]